MGRPRTEEQIKKSVKGRNEFYKTHEHPRGMLGKTHTPEVREIISKANTGKIVSEENKQKTSDRMSKLRQSQPITNAYSRCKRGYYDINGELMYFRSSWEPIYAIYLNILLKMKAIKSWEYEADTF